MAGDPSLIAPPQLLRGAHHPSSLQLRRRSLAIAAKSPTPRNRSNSGRWGTLPPPVERFNGSISEGAGVSRDNRFQNSKILDSSIFGFSPRISSPPCQRRRFVRVKARGCECFDLHQELVPYGRAWDWQKRIVEKKKALAERNEEFSDSLIVLQHLPIYTMGTGSDSKHLNFDVADAPFEIHRTERGGEVTYHGPGQLVMYPILNLRKHKMDLHWYLRALEEVVIRSLSTTFSIQASRVDGLTGVWVGDRKLAAIGIKVSQWITFHGLALNVTADLTPFNWITPCGIKDRRVGSIKQLLGESRLSDEHQDAASGSDDLQLINVLYESLVKEFCEVFQLEIHQQHMSEELTLLTRS